MVLSRGKSPGQSRCWPWGGAQGVGGGLARLASVGTSGVAGRMSFESRLRQESPRWIEAAGISREQAERLHSLHPEREGGAVSRFLAIISLLGAVLCAVGVALIISANWQEIHRWVKIVAMGALLGGAYGHGYWLKFQRADCPKLGEGFLMAGCIFSCSACARQSDFPAGLARGQCGRGGDRGSSGDSFSHAGARGFFYPAAGREDVPLMAGVRLSSSFRLQAEGLSRSDSA